jgi:long-subunit fatty acid transport protein
MAYDTLAIAANSTEATEVGHRLDIGADFFVPNQSATLAGNGAELSGGYSGNGSNPFILPNFDYVRPLSQRLALGIAVYGNGGMDTVYRNNPFAAVGPTGPCRGRSEANLRHAHAGRALGAGAKPGPVADQGKFDVPAAWGGGIAIRPVPAVTLALDAKRIDYADVTAVGVR